MFLPLALPLLTDEFCIDIVPEFRRTHWSISSGIRANQAKLAPLLETFTIAEVEEGVGGHGGECSGNTTIFDALRYTFSMASFAVIFDINGTLIDTETAHFLGYREALLPYGIEMTLEEFTDNWSRQGKKLDHYLEHISRHDLVPEYEKIKRKKDDIFQSTIKQRITLMPYARETLALLRSARIPLGVDTSGSHENMEMMLALFSLSDFFVHTADGDTEIDEAHYGSRKEKTSRLRYLADKFGVQPASCIMVGDAEKDILGAKEAGMRVIAVPNVYTKSQDFSGADVVCSSLVKVTLERCNAIL